MRADAPPPRFPAVIKLRAPSGLPAAVDAAARRQHVTAAQWMRAALLARLEAEGLHLAPDGSVAERPA